MKENLKISCYCSTFGRPNLLEESIESFLRQTYKNKELVIVNDCKEQKLIFNHPEVKIINLDKRINPIGKKFNFSANSCSGNILTPWDDDDIFLPWKLETIAKHLNKGLFHTERAFFESKPEKLVLSRNLFHCNLAMRKMKFNSIGGYLEENRRGLDSELIYKLNKEFGNFTKDIPDKEVFYIYRWSGADCLHLSSISNKNANLEELYEKNILNNINFKKGEIKLNPFWKFDYEKQIKDLLKKNETNPKTKN